MDGCNGASHACLYKPLDIIDSSLNSMLILVHYCLFIVEGKLSFIEFIEGQCCCLCAAFCKLLEFA